MKLINKTKSVVFAEDVVTASNPFKRMKGLLGRKELKLGQALILKPCNSIHTIFMRFPIDVLFVDKNSRVIRSISSLKPFCITCVYFNAAFAIELPPGIIQLTSTCQNDTLLID